MAVQFRDLRIGDYFVDLRKYNYPIVFQKKSGSTAYPLINGSKCTMIHDHESIPPETFSYGAGVLRIKP
jgi:hypothetical protein